LGLNGLVPRSSSISPKDVTLCALERKCSAHGLKDNQLLDVAYIGLTEGSRSYLDNIAGNIFRERTAEEAKELLNTIRQNHDDWYIDEDIIYGRGIHKFSDEVMKEASKSIKEKGIKTSEMKKCSEDGYKFNTNGPCFPSQVHAINFGKGNEEESFPTKVCFVNGSTYDRWSFDYDIKRGICENSRNIEIIHKNLTSCVDSFKMTVKHYHMMHNQVEEMISLQNKLYEKLLD
jgi:aldehyde:ferredoxin oxidoreductase